LIWSADILLVKSGGLTPIATMSRQVKDLTLNSQEVNPVFSLEDKSSALYR
jgi:hypothetical protein